MWMTVLCIEKSHQMTSFFMIEFEAKELFNLIFSQRSKVNIVWHFFLARIAYLTEILKTGWGCRFTKKLKDIKFSFREHTCFT